jgi:hypothetical protein
MPKEQKESVPEMKDEESSNTQSQAVSYKPGQKFPTPSPGSGDRVFYDTLILQRPESEMAQEWCVSHGTLDFAEAERIYKIICKRKNREYDYHPPSVKKTHTERSTNATRPKKIIDETNDDCDTGHHILMSLLLTIM